MEQAVRDTPFDDTVPVDVAIIGAGAAGLSTAHAVKTAGLTVRVLEKSREIAGPWRRRHPQLRLNTHRALSALPGMPMPRNAGTFPDRDTVVRYLVDYARWIDVPISFGVGVDRIDRSGDGWMVRTTQGLLRAGAVVVATGRDRYPHMPDWPGKDSFAGRLIHSAEFGDAGQYVGKRVLVVGAGNSGSDLLNHLVRVDTEALFVSVRHGPTVFPCRVFGFPMQRMSPFMEKFPLAVADRMLRDTERLVLGNLSAYGLPRYPAGGVSRMIESGVAPAIDDGFVAALKAGWLNVVPSVERFDAMGVNLVGGRHLEADVVIAATGYRTGLEPMVGHLDVLDDSGVPIVNGGRTADHCPGLWFIGMRPTLSGYFRAACRDSQQIATAIAAQRTQRNRTSECHLWPGRAKNAEA